MTHITDTCRRDANYVWRKKRRTDPPENAIHAALRKQFPVARIPSTIASMNLNSVFAISNRYNRMS
ncbi:hypothetical protein N9B39_01990, partial [bacterium]|nr:hypothetical protein [bacterium]